MGLFIEIFFVTVSVDKRTTGTTDHECIVHHFHAEHFFSSIFWTEFSFVFFELHASNEVGVQNEMEKVILVIFDASMKYSRIQIQFISWKCSIIFDYPLYSQTSSQAVYLIWSHYHNNTIENGALYIMHILA